jgi:hypothetical protein
MPKTIFDIVLRIAPFVFAALALGLLATTAFADSGIHRVPCGYQQLLVNSAASLTIPLACAGNASLAVIKAEVAPLRYLDNGSAPTTTVGMPIAITDAPIQYEGTISALQFIAQTSGGVVDVSFYK